MSEGIATDNNVNQNMLKAANMDTATSWLNTLPESLRATESLAKFKDTGQLA